MYTYRILFVSLTCKYIFCITSMTSLAYTCKSAYSPLAAISNILIELTVTPVLDLWWTALSEMISYLISSINIIDDRITTAFVSRHLINANFTTSAICFWDWITLTGWPTLLVCGVILSPAHLLQQRWGSTAEYMKSSHHWRTLE